MKNLMPCIDRLKEKKLFAACEINVMSEIPRDKNIVDFARDDNHPHNDKIVPIYADSVFERTTAVVFLVQEWTISEEYHKALKGVPSVVIYVIDIGRAMHELGLFFFE
ncbi:MAG: hypothetical protein R3Y43_02005 [Alphaproteobacteria bacterium]